jgi:arylsulfatase
VIASWRRTPKIWRSFQTPAKRFEFADITSNTYWDWIIDHVFLLVPAQSVVGEFLATFKEFPPRQKAASFTVDQVLEKLTQGITS